MSITYHTDILIIGGGAAGVAAAVAASGKGLTVTLVERSAYLGGKATAAEVGTVCGLFRFSKSPDPIFISNGFAKTFAENLQKNSGTKPIFNKEGLHFLPYDINIFKQTCLNLLLEEKNLSLFLNAEVEEISVQKNCIESVSVKIADELAVFFPKKVIDCSGDARIAKAANVESIEQDVYQAAAQVFTLQDVQEDNEDRLGLILLTSITRAIRNNQLPGYFDRVYVVQGSLKNNTVNLKLGIPVPVTYESDNLEQLRSTALTFIQELTDFLREYVDTFKNTSVKNIATEVGIRVGARVKGKYELTEDDILHCRKFEDAVANGSWPIEIWEQHRRVRMKYFQWEDYYQVPAGCLESKNVENLYMAGRNISASKEAIASARVMGTCLQTGYAAGYMAAGAVLHLSKSTIIKRIQTQQL